MSINTTNPSTEDPFERYTISDYLHTNTKQSKDSSIVTSTNNLTDRIYKLRNDYAKDNKKGIFGSKQYKVGCANSVLREIDVATLLKSTMIILPDSHHLFFDYTLFKTYAIPELYEIIIQDVMSKISYCINTYDKYEMHINLQSFTVSGLTRYKPIIEMYLNTLSTTNMDDDFNQKIKMMHIYNIPTTIENIAQICKPFINAIVIEKIVKYDKPTSEKSLKTIYEIIATANTIDLSTNVY